MSAYHWWPRYVWESMSTSRPWTIVKSIGSATPSDWQAGQRFTLAPCRTSARVLAPPGAGGDGAFVGAVAGGAAAGFGGVGAAGGVAGGVVAGAAGVAGVAVAGFGVAAGVVAAGAAGAGFGGGVGGAAGFAPGAAPGAAAGEGGVAGRVGAGAGVGIERSSSQIAAHTPHVWILLVDALQAWAPQFGQ